MKISYGEPKYKVKMFVQSILSILEAEINEFLNSSVSFLIDIKIVYINSAFLGVVIYK